MATTRPEPRTLPRDLAVPRAAHESPAGSARRRFNPDGNARLTAVAGLVLLLLAGIEYLTLLLGLQHFLSWHVFFGLVLLPPIALKLASTGWRFARYYTRNADYRLMGPPELLPRMLAPLLVLFTVVLFGSGVAMGLLHGHALEIARRLHGPSAFLWTVTLGAHILLYLRRALRSAHADAAPRTRRDVRGARARAWLAATAVVAGLVVGMASLPAQHHWLHLPARQDNGDHRG